MKESNGRRQWRRLWMEATVTCQIHSKVKLESNSQTFLFLLSLLHKEWIWKWIKKEKKDCLHHGNMVVQQVDRLLVQFLAEDLWPFRVKFAFSPCVCVFARVCVYARLCVLVRFSGFSQETCTWEDSKLSTGECERLLACNFQSVTLPSTYVSWEKTPHNPEWKDDGWIDE